MVSINVVSKVVEPKAISVLKCSHDEGNQSLARNYWVFVNFFK